MFSVPFHYEFGLLSCKIKSPLTESIISPLSLLKVELQQCIQRTAVAVTTPRRAVMMADGAPVIGPFLPISRQEGVSV